MMNNTLGLHSHHISGADNTKADFLSRLTSTSKQDVFQKYPDLEGFKQFHPGPEMLSTIWQVLLSGQSPEWNVPRLSGHFSPGSNIG